MSTARTRLWLSVALLIAISGAWLVIAGGPSSVDEGNTDSPPTSSDRVLMTDAALTSVSNAQSALSARNYGLARRELENARQALQSVVMNRTRLASGLGSPGRQED